jgi:DNA-binding XRE family transcriptional regulator
MDPNAISKSQALAAYANSQADLARALGVSRQAVHKLPDGPIPERWELKLRYELKPDVFAKQAA